MILIPIGKMSAEFIFLRVRILKTIGFLTIFFHEKWKKAVQLGATHVHARGVLQEAKREAIESHLIQEYDPPLNNE